MSTIACRIATGMNNHCTGTCCSIQLVMAMLTMVSANAIGTMRTEPTSSADACLAASAENCGDPPTTVAPRNSGGAHWNANGSNQADAQLWGRRARCLRARSSARAAEPRRWPSRGRTTATPSPDISRAQVLPNS